MLITFDPRRVISPHFGIILIYCRAGIYKKKISILTRIEKVDFLVNSPYLCGLKNNKNPPSKPARPQETELTRRAQQAAH